MLLPARAGARLASSYVGSAKECLRCVRVRVRASRNVRMRTVSAVETSPLVMARCFFPEGVYTDGYSNTENGPLAAAPCMLLPRGGVGGRSSLIACGFGVQGARWGAGVRGGLIPNGYSHPYLHPCVVDTRMGCKRFLLNVVRSARWTLGRSGGVGRQWVDELGHHDLLAGGGGMKLYVQMVGAFHETFWMYADACAATEY